MMAAGEASVVAFSRIQELDYALIQLALSAGFVVKPVPFDAAVRFLDRP
jgi:hypothetical protein